MPMDGEENKQGENSVSTEGLSEPQQMRGSPFEGAGCPDIGVVESECGEEGPCTAVWPSTRCEAHGGKKGFGEGVSQM